MCIVEDIHKVNKKKENRNYVLLGYLRLLMSIAKEHSLILLLLSSPLENQMT
jgi:hypothetical protein